MTTDPLDDLLKQRSHEITALANNLSPVMTRFRFWVCPNGCRGIVTWTGSFAVCGSCGETSEDRRL